MKLYSVDDVFISPSTNIHADKYNFYGEEKIEEEKNSMHDIP